MSGDKNVQGHEFVAIVSIQQEFDAYIAQHPDLERSVAALNFVDARRGDYRLKGRTPRQWIQSLGGSVPFYYDGE